MNLKFDFLLNKQVVFLIDQDLSIGYRSSYLIYDLDKHLIE